MKKLYGHIPVSHARVLAVVNVVFSKAARGQGGEMPHRMERGAAVIVCPHRDVLKEAI